MEKKLTALEIATAALELLACNFGDYPAAEKEASEALAAMRVAPAPAMNARERVLRDALRATVNYLQNKEAATFIRAAAAHALAAADAIPDAPVAVPDGPLWDSVRKNAAETDAWPDWKRAGSGLQMGPRKKPDAPVCPNCGPLGNDFCTWSGHRALMTAERRAELVEVMCKAWWPENPLMVQVGAMDPIIDALIKAGAVR